MSEVYLSEMDYRRLEEFRAQIEELNENITVWSEYTVKHTEAVNNLTIRISKLIDVLE